MIGQRKKRHYPVKVIEGSLIDVGARPYRKAHWYIWMRRALPLLLLVLMIEIFYFTIGSTATIRLTPITNIRESLISVVAVPHPLTSAQSLVHQLSTVQTKTVAVSATGTQDVPATSASGTLLWYNATTTEQTIAAHTRIIVSVNLQLETDAIITIPAAELPTPGEAEGPAHVTQAGSQGNIAANTLVDHVCGCGTGISVSNVQPFEGGQDEMSQSVLLQHDVDSAVAAEQDRLTPQVKGDLHQKAAAGEHVIERTCNAQALPDHPVGSLLPPHTQVKVAVSVTCLGLAYDQSDVQNKAISFFRQQTRPEGTYQLHSPLIHIVNATVESADVLRIAVQVRGEWVYQLSLMAKNTLLKGVAGTSSQQAQQYLDHFPGIQKSQLECRWIWLPSDPQHIALIEG